MAKYKTKTALVLGLVAVVSFLPSSAQAAACAATGANCGSDSSGFGCCASGSYCQRWNPWYYQCIAVPTKCSTVEVGVDYYGSDLMTIYNIYPSECCTHCTTTAGCKAYTFVNYNTDRRPACYLKMGPGTKKTSVGAVSATVTALDSTPTPVLTPSPTPTLYLTPACVANGGNCGSEFSGTKSCVSGSYCQPWNRWYYQCVSSPAKCSTPEVGVDYYGADLTTLYNVGASECCDKCAATTGCKAYTFVNYNADGRTACYLKTGTGTKKSLASAVSAVVMTATSTPTPASSLTPTPTPTSSPTRTPTPTPSPTPTNSLGSALPSTLVSSTDGLQTLCAPRLTNPSLLGTRPIPTNKWWGNLIACDSTTTVQPIYANPYQIQVVMDSAPISLSVSYPYRSRGYGGATGNGNANQYYYHSTVREFVFTANEFQTTAPTFQVVDWSDLGVKTQFKTSSGVMESYLVSGMAYMSMAYTNLTPKLTSAATIISVNDQTNPGTVSGSKFVIRYSTGQTWVLYSLTSDGTAASTISLTFTGSTLTSTTTLIGVLRVAVAVQDAWIATLDAHKTCVVQDGTVNVLDDSSYSFNWKTMGDCSGGLLHFALPHIAETIDTTSETSKVDAMVTYSTTHGPLQAYTSTALKWTMRETQAAPTGFYPPSTIDATTAEAQGLLTLLRADIDADWSVPMDGGYYFNGKAILKYASLCLVANDPVVAASNTTILSLCLGKLRTVMEPFVSNGWTNKLVYDSIYGGVISSSGITSNNRDADYGNSIYNDHHFQYGYWLHAAAIINSLDPTWSKLADMNTMASLLARDYANFATGDAYFPRFRSFDWFLGHSYAHGLTSMADGKDQESSSEDVNSAFALYMYGKTTGNAQMEAVGKLMTRVNAHAIKSYCLLLDSNTNHPESFRANKVASMIFDGKVNYGTWFSAEKTAIHGIQILPVSAVTQFVRTPQFVSEEWTQILSKLSMVTGSSPPDGWLSLLYLNYAIVDKSKAMSVLQTAPLDDGLSRSWAIYMAASYAN